MPAGTPGLIQSTTALGASATFTSMVVDSYLFGALSYHAPPILVDGFVSADQTGNIFFQVAFLRTFAGPHTFLTRAITATFTAGTNDFSGIRIPGRFFRIIYINDATPQAAFEIQFLVRLG